jgi:hypothetical protein
MRIETLPQARVVRKAGQLVAPPPAPPDLEPSWLGDHLRTALAYAVGLWPLTAVVLLVFGFLLLAGHVAPYRY